MRKQDCRRFFTGFWALALLTGTSIAHGFTLLYDEEKKMNVMGWPRSEILIDYDPTDCPSEGKLVGLLEASFQEWNEVSTSNLRLKLGRKVSESYGALGSVSRPAGNPVVICSPDFGPILGSSGLNDLILGFVVQPRVDVRGKIQFTFMVLNNTGGGANIFAGDLGVPTVAHELGHLIGLGHTQDEAALMYYATGEGAKGILAPDDVDGVTYLYPRREIGSDGLLGCGSIQALPGGPSGGLRDPVWIGFWVLLGILVIRRLNSHRFPLAS